MNLIDLSALSTSHDTYVSFLEQTCDRLQVDYASYAATNAVTGAVQGYATYPNSWKMHYMKLGLHRIDPTLHQSAKSIAPVDWSRFEQDKKFQAVFHSASDFGISNRGITVPVRGPYGDCGLFSITKTCKSDREWNKLRGHIASDLQMAAVHMHDSVMQSDVLSKALRQPKLSSREIEILHWTAAGKSQQDIGDILSISYRTVEVHLRSAREKLGALTTPQAIGRAIGLGIILPG